MELMAFKKMGKGNVPIRNLETLGKALPRGAQGNHVSRAA
jgi:hypothetical protein